MKQSAFYLPPQYFNLSRPSLLFLFSNNVFLFFSNKYAKKFAYVNKGNYIYHRIKYINIFIK